MRAIQAGEFCKLILREALLFTEFLDIGADREIDVLQCPRVESYAASLHPALKQVRKPIGAIHMDESIKDIETTSCPGCGQQNVVTAKECFAISCRAVLKSELECLRSIDKSLITVRRIAVWFLILSLLGVLIGGLMVIAAANGAKLF